MKVPCSSSQSKWYGTRYKPCLVSLLEDRVSHGSTEMRLGQTKMTNLTFSSSRRDPRRSRLLDRRSVLRSCRSLERDLFRRDLSRLLDLRLRSLLKGNKYRFFGIMANLLLLRRRRSRDLDLDRRRGDLDLRRSLSRDLDLRFLNFILNTKIYTSRNFT